ncbi:hypothetical protein [Streptomyces sp. NPDC001315]|uniref:hypothetical protein n=1 Tax=Streptomyces sp. NPDC001315 TaxID=3364562 RepID=UPI0036BCA1F1
MSDSSVSSGASAEPDFLDRLIARHAAPARAAARVRPRLPGPFERVEAVRARVPEPGGPDPLLWPAAPPMAAPDRDGPRPSTTAQARQRTERERTVVRTERAPGDPDPRPAARSFPEPPTPLRPAAPLAPRHRPAAESGRRPTGRERTDRDPARTTVSGPHPSDTDTATAVSAAARPSTADTAAAREAVRQAAARRPGRAPEQVVQVQIGRLEVTAAQPPETGVRQRSRAAERPGATVSLAEYLARGRE